MSKKLYGVAAIEPSLLGGLALLLAVVALLAGYIPARRATRVDPMVHYVPNSPSDSRATYPVL